VKLDGVFQVHYQVGLELTLEVTRFRALPMLDNRSIVGDFQGDTIRQRDPLRVNRELDAPW